MPFVGWDVTSFDFQVYDRWGKLMFQATASGQAWDGTHKGKKVNTGVYTYVIKWESSETGPGEQVGNITVIR